MITDAGWIAWIWDREHRTTHQITTEEPDAMDIALQLGFVRSAHRRARGWDHGPCIQCRAIHPKDLICRTTHTCPTCGQHVEGPLWYHMSRVERIRWVYANWRLSFRDMAVAAKAKNYDAVRVWVTRMGFRRPSWQYLFTDGPCVDCSHSFGVERLNEDHRCPKCAKVSDTPENLTLLERERLASRARMRDPMRAVELGKRRPSLHYRMDNRGQG
jgi:predicted Zn-ribbon and HTH transcriptional regulator